MKSMSLAARVAIAAGLGIVAVAPAVAQQAPSAQQAQVKTYSFSGLSIAEVQLLGKALSTLPYAEVAGLLSKLQKQIEDQETKGESGGKGKGESADPK